MHIVAVGFVESYRDLVRSEGQKMCSLDKDEADTLFDSCHHYVRRLFAAIPLALSVVSVYFKLMESIISSRP